MKTDLPIICICEPYSCGPNLGILENFGFKSSELSFSEEIKLGYSEKGDEFERFDYEFFVVYKGKRPKIHNKMKHYEVYCD